MTFTGFGDVFDFTLDRADKVVDFQQKLNPPKEQIVLPHDGPRENVSAGAVKDTNGGLMTASVPTWAWVVGGIAAAGIGILAIKEVLD